ncbi:ATP-binding protein [Actinoplanes sp. NPDC023714]|uniref:ATP-binding protein n=1 Tax=Actinoplanes sp. NPDC023714 TaxID=3154322 RepID=UPI003405F3BB
MTALPASVPPGEAVELGRWTVESYPGLRHLRAALREAVEELAPVLPSAAGASSVVGASSAAGASGGASSAAGASGGGSAGSDDEDDVAERIAVVATELATNALRHGRPPAEVRLLRVGDLLVVDACDHDPEGEPQFDTERPLGQGGLGLLLARTFALEVGWHRDGSSKHVWASFPFVYGG